MFERRALTDALSAVRDEYAPSALVVDAANDFETLPPSVAENLLAVVDGVEPLAYDETTVPPDAPDILHRLADSEFTVGAPGDGGVTWTRQTSPPTVIVKPRLEGSPEPFIDFLIAEALVELHLDSAEHFLGFFGDAYEDLNDAVPLSPVDTYQLAAALHTAHIGRRSRPVFDSWADQFPDIHAAWADAGERLEPRLADLSADVATGRTDFADAAELACNALKHDSAVPKPFDALDTEAYTDHGAPFAVRWAEKTFAELDTD
ncbi:uncharacterized protein NP_0598A [Natronomonas pharaonis DSM 2160]|uniref:Uncharacterized protein n=1 Tax=Natronomonas pharaonis (strain ATCC 35678 / DSM 2160 / CIP 103997 / JCM 8858 / NBRC 14720 / NCIMB 2260 / Gabara) TaxID=348780 RepID=A0A1U7ETX7_NATPD|nr:hypothetical protein [Natronomonas pharaonis]CAI48390.1 uncharacterized protein NP_0598A [Natronomonas pharaonis DSM 2160]